MITLSYTELYALVAIAILLWNSLIMLCSEQSPGGSKIPSSIWLMTTVGIVFWPFAWPLMVLVYIVRSFRRG